MRRVLAFKLPELGWDRENRLCFRDIPFPRDAVTKRRLHCRAEQLLSEVSGEDLGEERRRGVADLVDLLTIVAFYAPSCGETLKPQHLADCKWATLPVERSG